MPDAAIELLAGVFFSGRKGSGSLLSRFDILSAAETATMPDLEPCVECGNLLSKSAEKCPKCECRYPWGVDCKICGGRLKMSEAVDTEGTRQSMTSHVWFAYHVDCYRKVMPHERVQIPCPDCQSPTSRLLRTPNLVKEAKAPCPNCGRPNPFKIRGELCLHCGLPIIEALHQWVDRPGQEPGYSGYHMTCTAYGEAQKDCQEIERRKQEGKEKNRRVILWPFLRPL
jgi:hypothetical protein